MQGAGKRMQGCRMQGAGMRVQECRTQGVGMQGAGMQGHRYCSEHETCSLPVLEWHMAWFCCLQARDLIYASRSHCEDALKK